MPNDETEDFLQWISVYKQAIGRLTEYLGTTTDRLSTSPIPFNEGRTCAFLFNRRPQAHVFSGTRVRLRLNDESDRSLLHRSIAIAQIRFEGWSDLGRRPVDGTVGFEARLLITHTFDFPLP